MEKYDLCVIGGGPSGYAAAMRAVDFNKSVLLVERDRIGGAGIYDGALSSKTFWEISKEFSSFSKKMRHYGLPEPEVDFMGLDAEYTALGTSLLRKQESFALVREGSLVGIITDRAYLKHSLMRRMESGKIADQVPDSYYDKLEARLLAWDRVAYDLTRKNRWAP